MTETSHRADTPDATSKPNRPKGFGRYTTRESWLLGGVKFFRPWFRKAGFPLPDHVRVSIGFPYGTRQENEHVLGATYRASAADDNVHQVYISPTDDDPIKLLLTLLHELAHCAVFDDGHRGRFAKIMHEFGFEGALTEVHPSLALEAEIYLIAERLGAFPGAKLNVRTRQTPGVPVPVDPITGKPIRISTAPAPQRARNLKVQCAFGGAHHVRTTRRMVDQVGMPGCACHHLPMTWAPGQGM